MGRPAGSKNKKQEVEIEVEVIPNKPTEPTPLVVEQKPEVPVIAMVMSKDIRMRSRDFSKEEPADKNGRKWRSLIPKKRS